MTKLLCLFAAMTLFFSGGERYLSWKADERLDWSDFQGPVDHSSEMMAHTVSRINYTWTCEGGKFTARVEAVFDREMSWKKELETHSLLAHEQLHFDITELYARRLRATFAEIENPCQLDPGRIRTLADSVRAEWKAIQKQYDLDSDHGRLPEEQNGWKVSVREEIEAFSGYRETPE